MYNNFIGVSIFITVKKLKKLRIFIFNYLSKKKLLQEAITATAVALKNVLKKYRRVNFYYYTPISYH